MLPCSFSHMLRCLPAPKSICSVNKLASLPARNLPLGRQCWEESQQTFPLRVLAWTPGRAQMPGHAVGAGASPGSLGCWVQPWGFVAGSQAQVGQVPGLFCG